MKIAVDVYAELVHEMRKSYYAFYNCSGINVNRIINIITGIRLIIIMYTSYMVVCTYLFRERQLSVTVASPILRPNKRTNLGKLHVSPCSDTFQLKVTDKVEKSTQVERVLQV